MNIIIININIIIIIIIITIATIIINVSGGIDLLTTQNSIEFIKEAFPRNNKCMATYNKKTELLLKYNDSEKSESNFNERKKADVTDIIIITLEVKIDYFFK
ncbi:hypothetical protein BJ944DRAFT_228190 [Cunninghamella echinulata]|nr:hypothetical protein BJ944DRAFT_228190 [Cunninghamella echinulata]